jgi:hypothetical protein
MFSLSPSLKHTHTHAHFSCLDAARLCKGRRASGALLRVHAAFSYECMKPHVRSYECMKPSATGVCGLELLVYAACAVFSLASGAQLRVYEAFSFECMRR